MVVPSTEMGCGIRLLKLSVFGIIYFIFSTSSFVSKFVSHLPYLIFFSNRLGHAEVKLVSDDLFSCYCQLFTLFLPLFLTPISGN